ncbi:hypothetical protein BV20DRAFT_258924 [Pilatotrama ljubarskyi]|nr:hypothetical protein BV20DRAFT_258924 [Pilatotrama ljubarskyi]
MFIAIIGTRLAGKSTLQNFLSKHKGFIPVKLLDHSSGKDLTAVSDGTPGHGPKLEAGDQEDLERFSSSETGSAHHRISFLSMASPISSCLPSPAPDQEQVQPIWFHSSSDMLAHVTKNWRTDFVTTDLDTPDMLDEFMTRPFVLVVSVDAPLLIRYRRSLIWSELKPSLEDFIREHDAFYYGPQGRGQHTPSLQTAGPAQRPQESFRSLNQLAHVHVVNSFETISGLQEHLMELNLMDPERLRPGWDTYFMELASLASQRSNCMKRRVGAILVRNKRVVSTGYNGTPRGLTNCNEGGCARCNTASETPDECLCLHAEENALLEAGRERVGDGAVLYCNTCPCLKCTIKIIQTGVTEVVYNLSYKVDDASAALFSEAGVILRRHAILA